METARSEEAVNSKAEQLTIENAAEAADEVADLAADLDAAQLHLSSGSYLYLSGTPFRALT